MRPRPEADRIPSDLPLTFAETREALRAVTCYAIAPARKALTGRIGLRAFDGGFATPPFDDGTRYAVRGDELVRGAGLVTPITTVSAAAAFFGITAISDPGVGRDLPAFSPETDLAVDPIASHALGAWYALAQRVIDKLTSAPAGGVSAEEAQLWPEHFDLATVVTLSGNPAGVNVGFSPGDGFCGEPYVYVGPHDRAAMDGEFWNAPFGAYLPYEALVGSQDAEAAALAFILEGLHRVH